MYTTEELKLDKHGLVNTYSSCNISLKYYAKISYMTLYIKRLNLITTKTSNKCRVSK